TFPANMTDASVMTSRKLVIRNLIFEGGYATGATQPIGLRLSCTENLHVEDCIFHTCDTGLELTFCLGAQVNNCETNNCLTHGFVAQSANGLWTGATISNTPSNQTKFQSCRNYAHGGMLDAFRVYGAN